MFLPNEENLCPVANSTAAIFLKKYYQIMKSLTTFVRTHKFS